MTKRPREKPSLARLPYLDVETGRHVAPCDPAWRRTRYAKAVKAAKLGRIPRREPSLPKRKKG